MKTNKYIKTVWLCANFFLLLLLSGCAELFQKRLDMPVLPAGELFRFADEGQLDAPRQLFASKGGSPTTVTLSWEKVKGAVSYLIECAEAPIDGGVAEADLEWNVLENSHYKNSYEHRILQLPQTKSEAYAKRFYYRVYAKNERDGRDESGASNMDYGVLLSPPAGVEADKGEDLNAITVRWQPVANTASYDIYRSRNSDGSSAVQIGSRLSNLTQYTDTVANEERGVEFYYVIYARNRDNVQSAGSTAGLGFARVPGAPGKTSGVKATRLADPNAGIDVSWDATSGADKYYLYRSSSVDSSLQLLTKGGETGTTYTDKKSLKAGVYYYYQVQAVKVENGAELKGPFSDKSEAATGFVLSPPTEMDAEKKNGKVSIRWQPALGNAAEQAAFTYKIYSDTNKDGAFATQAGSEIAAGSATVDADGYLTAQVDSGSFFKIETISGGKTSAKSAVFAPAPLPATNISATRAKNVGGSANTSGVYPVKVTWEKPSNDNPEGYHIYRSTSADSGYRKITESPVSASTLEYLDKDAAMKVGKYYYYKVLSVNVLGQGKNYSGSTYGYGALTHTQFLKEFGKQITSSQKKLTLMHKGGTSALGSESARGNVSGTLSYSASVAGLGARIIMPYSNYCDAYIDGKVELGPYMIFNGNTNTTADMSSNGSMDGTVSISGMYSGSVGMGNIQVKGGRAGGGHYPVTVNGFGTQNVDYKVIN